MSNSKVDTWLAHLPDDLSGVETREDELVRFQGETFEDAISAWVQLDEAEEAIQWRRGAIAAAISENRVYGEGNLEQFARSVGQSCSAVKNYARAYRRVAALRIDLHKSILSLKGLSWWHFLACTSIKDDEEYVGLLTQAHDEGWSVSRLSEQVAMQRALREQHEQLFVEEHDRATYDSPPIEEAEAGEPPPEVLHPVLGRIGYLKPEIRDTMAEKLDAMNEGEREDAYRRLGNFDPMFTRRLAGLPTREDAQDGAEKSNGDAPRRTPEQLALRPAVIELCRLIEYDPEALAKAADHANHARELLVMVEEVPAWAERFVSALERKSSEGIRAVK